MGEEDRGRTCCTWSYILSVTAAGVLLYRQLIGCLHQGGQLGGTVWVGVQPRSFLQLMLSVPRLGTVLLTLQLPVSKGN